MAGLLEHTHAVIFDVGNTLTRPDWRRIAEIADRDFALRCDETALHNSLCKILSEADGNEEFLRSLARKLIPANWHFRRVYTDLGLTESQLAHFSDALDAAHRERHLWTTLNDEAIPVLEELKRREMPLAVISNSEDGRVTELLHTIGIQHYFDLCIDSHLIEYAKPDPRIFLHAVKQLNVAPDEAVYVGDSYTQDITGAHDAGLRAILYDPLGLHTQSNNHFFLRIRSLLELIRQ
ncbi:MAG: HAD family hydrolase [Pyrinomonadaceae bacterium]